MKIITLSREFGSGGRELGKRLADALGIAYYDKEIVNEIAKKVQMDEHYIENVLDKGFTINYPYTFQHSFSLMSGYAYQTSQLLAQQHQLIRSLAQKEDCIIVGRSADTVLEDLHPLKLFVYADMPARLARCRKRAPEDEHLTERELEKKIRQIDKSRASYHDLISSYGWGDMHSYNLCINTTGVEIKTVVPEIADFARTWFAETQPEETK